MDKQAYSAALQWYLDNGVDEALGDEVVDYYALSAQPKISAAEQVAQMPINTNSVPPSQSQSPTGQVPAAAIATTDMQPAVLGASDARNEAIKIAKAANTLDELKKAISDFDGIGLKKTATNVVFGDGNPEAKIMLIGEAPGADEDREGKPFMGQSGQFLDKILAAIDLDRKSENALESIYFASILNWRPPGNRTPAPGEIEASLPFVERHIQLIKPKILIFCGNVPAKSLLASSDGMSKLRKKWHDYSPQVEEFKEGTEPIKSLVTFHPEYLLKNPLQKKAVWADLLMIQKHRIDGGMVPN